MNVLCVIDSLGSGGAQRQMVNLATGLQASGNNVTLFVYHPNHHFYRSLVNTAGIKVIEVDAKSGFSILVLAKLISIINSGVYTSVISFLNSPNVYVCLAKFLSFSSIRLIVSERSSRHADSSRIYSVIRRLIYFSADFVVSNSYTHSNYLSSFGWLKSKVKTIYNGYSITPFSASIPVLQQTNFSLLVVGRINFVKNGLRLFRALLLFYERNGFLPELYWAGRQDSDKNSLSVRRDIEDFISQYPFLSTNVHWLGERSDIPDLMSSMHALIHVSLYEGLPNAICEAFICGLPVIASSVCDHPLLVKSDERGILCNPLSIYSICSAIEYLYSSSISFRKKITLNGRLFSENNLSIHQYVSQFSRLLE